MSSDRVRRNCAGCAIKPKIARWHDQLYVDQAALNGANELDFGVFGFDPEGAGKSGFKVTDLTADGQAALIKAVGKKTADADKLLAALGGSIDASPSGPGDVDTTIVGRRFVFSIAYLPIHPADRIQMLTMRLLPRQEGVTFMKWTQLTTKYETMDLASLTYDTNFKLDASAGLGPSVIKELKEPKGSASLSQELKETRDLKLKYTALTGRLAKEEMYIFEKAAPNVDLSGPVTVDATLKVPARDVPVTVSDFSGLTTSSGPAEPAQVSVTPRLMDVPKWRGEITGCAEAIVWVRLVCGGGSSMSESDDCAKLVPIVRTASVVLSPGIKTYPYELQVRDAGGIQRATLAFEGGSPVRFRSARSADDLRRYLMAKFPAAFGATPLALKDARLILWTGSASADFSPLLLHVVAAAESSAAPAAENSAAPTADDCGPVLAKQQTTQSKPAVGAKEYLDSIQRHEAPTLKSVQTPPADQGRAPKKDPSKKGAKE